MLETVFFLFKFVTFVYSALTAIKIYGKLNVIAHSQ